MTIKLNFKIFFIYIFAFYLLYLPDFSYLIGINGYLILGILTLLYLTKYSLTKNSNYFSYYKRKPTFIFIVLTVISAIYFIIRAAIAGVSITDIDNLRVVQNLIPIFYLIGAVTIFYELDRQGYSKKQKYKFIINVAMIQGIIALCMLVFPSLKEIAFNIFYQNREINQYISQSRLYGICNGDYTYSLQIMHSILALFCLFYAYYYKDKKSLISFILILLVTFLNGRFGLVIFIIGFVLFILNVMLKTMNPLKIFQIILLSIVVFIMGYYVIINYVPNTYKLIIHAINDITSFLQTGNSTTEMYDLVSSFRFPEGLYLIIGMGYRVFGGSGKMFNANERSSDIGFVNDAYMGGLIYMMLLYSGYLYIIRKIDTLAKKKSFEKIMTKVLLVSMILANIKGEVFRSQILTTVFIMLIVFMLFEGEKENEK